MKYYYWWTLPNICNHINYVSRIQVLLIIYLNILVNYRLLLINLAINTYYCANIEQGSPTSSICTRLPNPRWQPLKKVYIVKDKICLQKTIYCYKGLLFHLRLLDWKFIYLIQRISFQHWLFTNETSCFSYVWNSRKISGLLVFRPAKIADQIDLK